MITLKEISQQSGFSIRTIRRALEGMPNVSREKREIILEIARKNNYTPNIAARNLRLKKKNFVGILFENSGNITRKLNTTYSALIKEGFCPILGRIVPGREAECKQMLFHWIGMVDYVVVFPDPISRVKEFIHSLPQQYPVKFIYVDCDFVDSEYSIPVNRAASVRNMINSLNEKNFRKLLYCGNTPSRLQGVEEARKDLQLSIQIEHLASGHEFDDGEKTGPAVMASKADAVFFDTDRMATGFYRYAAKNGISIPQDISVIGFDDETFDEFLTPALSTLAHPSEDISNRVIQLINGKDTANLPPLLMSFIIRDSIKL